MDDFLGFLAILLLASVVMFVAFALLHVLVFLGLLVAVILLPGFVKGLLEKPPRDL